ncbi:hypothetical protein NP493_319g05021 [Ridgeia piscesae]|uniref:G-protein coupled receptors family 1 profile domain-containing protein n=1 Tax=Ridgeia piscesae TaxID=27915 RepID=A0AAD9L5H5_RIDPI|nr:hypothetical protein NP493_319g05021 [Ridgeia piscesae]
MSDLEFDDVKPFIIVAIILLNLALNSLVIAVIVKHPQLREDRTTLFMLSLALSDLANGCTTMPISAVVCSKTSLAVRNELTYLPRIQAFFSSWFMVVSTNSLCWLTVCKMIAITNPLRIDTILTRRRCYCIITGIWISAGVFASTFCIRQSLWNFKICLYDIRVTPTLPVDTLAILIFGVAFALLLPQVIIVYSTVRIFNAILRTHRQIAALSNSIEGHRDFIGNIPTLTFKSIRSGRNVLIICLVYVLLTIPAAVYTIAVITHMENRLPANVQFFSIWILFCHTFVSSLFYLVLFRCIRRKAIDIIKDVGKLFTCD